MRRGGPERQTPVETAETPTNDLIPRSKVLEIIGSANLLSVQRSQLVGKIERILLTSVSPDSLERIEEALGVEITGEEETNISLGARVDQIVEEIQNLQNAIEEVENEEGIRNTETEGLSPDKRIKLIIEKVEERVRDEFEDQNPELVATAVLEGLLGISWSQLNTLEQRKIEDEFHRYHIPFDPDKT